MTRYCYLNEKNPYFSLHLSFNFYHSIIKTELLILSAVLTLFVFMFYPVFSNAKSNELAQSPVNETKVLGITSEIISYPLPFPIPTNFNQFQPIPTPTPTISPPETPTPTPSKPYSKNSYSIAVYGDSMIDTMGERLEYLEKSLKKLYPSVNFTLYNYGKGAENVEMALERWNSRLDYQNRHYPAISEVKPDIIILGSFAYNPFSPHDRDRHWIGLTKLIEQAKTVTPNIYLLAEIAPLRSNFGKGPQGVNWDENTAYTHSGYIIEQLENAVGLATTLNIPLIDVFHASRGNPSYVNPSDGIHPSVLGHQFTAEKIAERIKLN